MDQHCFASFRYPKIYTVIYCNLNKFVFFLLSFTPPSQITTTSWKNESSEQIHPFCKLNDFFTWLLFNKERLFKKYLLEEWLLGNKNLPLIEYQHIFERILPLKRKIIITSLFCINDFSNVDSFFKCWPSVQINGCDFQKKKPASLKWRLSAPPSLDLPNLTTMAVCDSHTLRVRTTTFTFILLPCVTSVFLLLPKPALNHIISICTYFV